MMVAFVASVILPHVLWELINKDNKNAENFKIRSCNKDCMMCVKGSNEKGEELINEMFTEYKS